MFQRAWDTGLQIDVTSTSSAWVDMFRWLGLGVKFPLPEASGSEVRHFANAVALVPLIMIVIGLVVALTTLVGLCCCCKRSARDRPVKPSSLPILSFAIFTFAFIGASSLVCLATGNSSYTSAVHELDRASSDIYSAVTTGKTLNSTGEAMLKSLTALQQKCPDIWNNPFAHPQLAELQDQIATYKQKVATFTTYVEPIANATSIVQEHHELLGGFLTASLALPMVLVSITCFCIISAVVSVRCCGGSDLARCCDICCFKLGGSCVSFAVLIAVVVASAQVALGIAMSSFCANADESVLGYAKYDLGANSTEFKTAAYYITDGAGENPIMTELNSAQSYLEQANASFAQFDALWPLIKVSCSDWNPNDIEQDLTTVETGVLDAKKIVDLKNIYPYYDEIVHENACGTVISSLGFLVIFQLAGGMLLLPVMATASASFFKRWAAWKESLRQMGDPSGLIESRAY
jgi:hypothetical protein